MIRVIVFRGKVLTRNEGLAMAPLSTPEQRADFRLEHNLVFPTQRKPDATSAGFPRSAMQHTLAPAVGARF